MRTIAIAQHRIKVYQGYECQYSTFLVSIVLPTYCVQGSCFGVLLYLSPAIFFTKTIWFATETRRRDIYVLPEGWFLYADLTFCFDTSSLHVINSKLNAHDFNSSNVKKNGRLCTKKHTQRLFYELIRRTPVVSINVSLMQAASPWCRPVTCRRTVAGIVHSFYIGS